MRRVWVVALVGLSSVACIEPKSVTCGDLVCATGQTCSPSGTFCVLAAQITPCNGLGDGDPCSYDNFNGRCAGGACFTNRCGDSSVDPAEVCDDGNTESGDGCSADCRSKETCGNGIVDVVTGELCDDENSDDTDGCHSDCSLPRCRDGFLDPGEICDDGNSIEKDGCNALCSSTEVCGNRVIDPQVGERCDAGTENSNAPNATCRTDCQYARCGDGIVDTGEGEACDGSVGSTTCQSLGYYSGTLTCTAGCQLDIGACSGRCGDGVKNGTEACDGSDFGGQACTSKGFYTGALSCTSNCMTVITTGCSGSCGDGIKNGSEECDGTDLGGRACPSYGFHNGSLSCGSSCTISTASCQSYCGDGIVNGPELCDGTDQSGQDCTAVGAAGGAIGCSAYCQPSYERCHWGRWKAVPTPTTQAINDVWTAPDGTAWAVSGSGFGAGHIYRVTNLDWEEVTPPGLIAMYAIWGSNSDDIWATGWSGATAHWDGTTWTVSGIGLGANMNSIFGFGPNDVWAVGEAGKIGHWNGTTWTGSTSGTINGLYAVWGAAPNDLWAVGFQGTLLRYNGTSWSAGNSPTNAAHLEGVWGSSANRVYVAGSQGLYEWNGSSWSTITAQPMTAVWGTGASDVWAVGQATMHFDGSTWSTKTSGTTKTLQSISGRAPHDIWATGADGAAVHYDGPGWTPVPTGVTTELVSVWGSDPSHVWMVSGSQSENARVVFWDGSTTSNTQLAPGSVYDVWGSSANDVYITGFGRTLRNTGSGWNQVENGGISIWGNSATDIWVSPAFAQFQHYTGTWSSQDQFGTVMYGIWGSGSNDIWSVGGHPTTAGTGVIGHYDGTSWTGVTSPVSYRLYSTWGNAPGNFWASGEAGTTLHLNGSTWSTIPSGTSTQLNGVFGDGPATAWFVGYAGTLMRWDGSSFSTSVSNTSAGLNSVWASGPSDVWAVGTGGSAVHLSHPLPVSYGGACTAPIPIYCSAAGTTVYGATVGASNNLVSYSGTGCPSPRADNGREISYKLESPISGQITLTLTPHAGDLDLVVLDTNAAGGCDATACLKKSQSAGVETVTLPVTQGKTLYFVVDGFNGASAGYSLQLTCTKQ